MNLNYTKLWKRWDHLQNWMMTCGFGKDWSSREPPPWEVPHNGVKIDHNQIGFAVAVPEPREVQLMNNEFIILHRGVSGGNLMHDKKPSKNLLFLFSLKSRIFLTNYIYII